jgi:HTH-like domain
VAQEFYRVVASWAVSAARCAVSAIPRLRTMTPSSGSMLSIVPATSRVSAMRGSTPGLNFDRTYGARRIWHDMLAEGMSCGLHRIERLMRQ